MQVKIEGTINNLTVDGQKYIAGGQGQSPIEIIVNGTHWSTDLGATQTLFVNTTRLNIRSAPYGTILTSLPYGTPVIAYNQRETSNDGLVWRYIKTGGTLGWCAEKYLSASTSTGGGSGSTTPGSYNVKVITIDSKLGYEFKGDPKHYRHPVWMNIRPLPFFGTQQHAKWTSLSDIGRYIAEAKAMGAKVIRFYAASPHFSPTECAARTLHVLDLLQKAEMYGHVVLDDSLGDSGLIVPGADAFRTAHQKHINRLYYYPDAQGNYPHWLPYHNFIRAFLPVVKSHPAVFSFQLRNEWAMHSEDKTKPTNITPADAAAARKFAVHTVNLIKDITSHQVDLGLISIGHVTPGSYADGSTFYAGMRISFVGSHWYSDDGDMGRFQTDRALAKALRVPHVVDEVGVPYRGGNRVNEYVHIFNSFTEFVAAYTVWGMDLGHGVGDDKGFSSTFGDYLPLKDLFRQWNPA